MGLLILSQVVLSFQLPFALVPLVQFTGDKSRMGQFANSWWAALAWLTAAAIILLNALLIVRS
jgi:manganese transport protein